MDKIEQLIAKMSVAEKALLCSGRKFWFTRGIKKYGIEPYMVTDGPHGLRKQDQSADNLGVNDSVKATCFPTACVMASTWDTDLIYQLGEKIAEEAKEENVGIVLGPGANIKRNPLCGRNFEYYSEDPLLSGKCAASFIKGIQKSGIGTSLKHFAANNQEDNRLRINAVVDERALRELYLASFEIAVKEGEPYTLMCAYNQVNGAFASESKYLLTDVLRKDWGFKGYVMTDWGAINNRVDGLKAGLDLEMPGGSAESIYDIINAVESGELKIEVLNETVRRLLAINFKVKDARVENYKYDREAHHQFARKVASEGAVLLKNEDNILPLNPAEPLTIIGALAKTPRYQGSGSSLIKCNKLTSFYDQLLAEKINFKYEEGYSAISDVPDDAQIYKAVELAKKASGTIVVAMGLTLFYESEGFDRKHMSLPTNQNILLSRILDLGKNVVVLLFGGSPVEMPWIKGVKGLINMYLPGQACGEATADVLFGRVNPSGKLAETFPLSVKDCSSFNYFPEGPVSVEYRESIFVGYRYFATAKKEVLFPFGYGLSYTQFKYSNMQLSNTAIKDVITVSFDITNTGSVVGKEVAELYVRKINSKIFRADRELKAFAKVELEPNETKTIVLSLDERAFSYYDVTLKDWAIEGGEYRILVGANSQDVQLKATVTYTAASISSPYDNDKIADYFAFNGKVSDVAFREILGTEIPSKQYCVEPIRMLTITSENNTRWFGRLFSKLLIKGAAYAFKGDDENSVLMKNFMTEMLSTNTLRSMATCSGGMLTKNMVNGLIVAFNGHFFKGVHKIVKAFFANRKQNKVLLKIENEI